MNMAIIVRDNYMRIFLAFFFFSTTLFGQSFSESDIRNLAIEVNEKIKGVDIGNGTTVIGCFSVGRTLVFNYDMPSYWEPPLNIKEDLITNQKTIGTALNYFSKDINVHFCYYIGNSLIKKVSIKSNEFSTYNYDLGEYLSIKDHAKSKGINLKIKPPKGWDIKEGNRPNIVKKFTKGDNTFLISTKENATFFSRSEVRELLSDDSYVNELLDEAISYIKVPKLIDQSVVTIDTYPALTYKFEGTIERLGLTIPAIMRCWVVFYEDKVVSMKSFGTNNAEFRALEQLYLRVINSVIFPDQYN
jgi:hypothetical protein|tara:strand:- start:846 stop:1751 length:906 start_codon:yes stop_codon:yes gene_type:complete